MNNFRCSKPLHIYLSKKVLFPLAFIAFWVAGCGTLSRGIVRENPSIIYDTTDTPLRRTPELRPFLSDTILIIPEGEKLIKLGWYRTGGTVNFDYILYGTDTGFVDWHELTSSPTLEQMQRWAQMKAVRNFPTDFIVPKDSIEFAWNRAKLFLSHYSSMETQIESGDMLKSYDPLKVGDVGYRISRYYDGVKTEFSVYCLYFDGLIGEPFYNHATWNAHVAAYYIANGILYDNFLE